MAKVIKVYVEKYKKSNNGKFYCCVYFNVGKMSITVGEFQTDDEDTAKEKALKQLKELVASLEVREA